MSNSKNVFVAGHRGMVGSAILRKLRSEDNINILLADRDRLDLLSQQDTIKFFKNNNIDMVYLAAARVGGIHANNAYPAEFIYNNIVIQSNIIHASHITDVNKLLFLGSSCIYPKFAKQPICEESLLTGQLEPTNEPYAIAKIAGIKMCESYNRQYGRQYRSVMPTNLYGPNDSFHPENSHVLPALMRRLHEAKEANSSEVVIWGTGSAMREFLHVDDMARACLFIMNIDKDTYTAHVKEMASHINVGTGEDCTIRELAQKLAHIIGYKGELVYDKSKPDGTPRKLLDVSRLRSMGWSSSINLDDGLYHTYKWFLENKESMRS